MLGTLGWLGIPINRFNGLSMLLLIGPGFGYGGFLLTSELASFRGQGDHQHAAFGAVLVCFVIAVCVFLPLAFSHHTGLRSIGAAGAIALVASLTAAILIVPAMANWLLPRDSHRAALSVSTMLAPSRGTRNSDFAQPVRRCTTILTWESSNS